MASQQKALFINSIRQVFLQNNSVVPTVVLYKNKNCYVGVDALQNCDDFTELKEDFKVQIGEASPLKLAQRIGGRSILGIAKDFIATLTQQAINEIELQGGPKPSRILIAEPISLDSDQRVTEEWLKNYRLSIRRILESTFEEVDFLPEPFAVFQ